MEVKNYFATDSQGNVLGSAQVYLYLAGTTTLATGLQNISGAALANPFTSQSNGLVQFKAPDADYDLRVVKPGREFTIRIQCFDGVAFFRDLVGSPNDPNKGLALIPYKLNAIGAAVRNAYDKIQETRTFDDFKLDSDGDDWYPAIQRAFDWAQSALIGSTSGIRFRVIARTYRMSQRAKCNVAQAGMSTGTGGIQLVIDGEGDGVTNFVAMPGNADGCIWLTSDRNTECYRVGNLAFLSDLDEDAATNNGIALQIDSSLTRGGPGYGDHPRWSVEIHNVYIGGFGTTAGNLARRGNWKKGIYVANKWYAKFNNVRCLARYSGVLGARTACDYAIHLYNCYSPDFDGIYIHGNWDHGVYLEDILNNPGFEDFRFVNTFFVGPNKGLTIDHSFTNTSTFRLNEPGGAISVIHLNCRQYGLKIKNHRQVMIDGVYGYAPDEAGAQGELLPSVIVLDGASDIRIKAQILEPGFYNSNTNASVGVKIENDSEAITLDLQLGAGGIGLLNNSTSPNKTIVADLKLLTSRRNSAWVAPLVPVVDNAGGVLSTSNNMGAAQDRVTLANSKSFTTSYPVAHRVMSELVGQLFGGAYEIAGKNSAGTTVNQMIMRAGFVDAPGSTAGYENTRVGMFIMSAGTVAEALRLQRPSVNNDSFGYLSFLDDAGAVIIQRVKRGAANSGGTGRRALLVDN